MQAMTDVGSADASSRNKILVLGFLASLLEGYDLQVMTVVSPFMRHDMQLSPSQFGFAFSSSIAGLAIGAVLLGALADRSGRKPVLVGSLVLLAVFTMMSAHADGLTTLLLFRFCGGFGMGGVLPTVIAISAAAVPPARRTSVVTVIACAMLLGGVLVAWLGSWVVGWFGWHMLFNVGADVTILAAVATWLLLPRLAEMPESLAVIPYREALFGGGRRVATVLLWLLFILTLSVLSLLLGWAPVLVAGKGLPPSSGFMTILAVNLGGMVGSLAIGWLCEKWQACSIMLVVYAGMAVSLGLFALSSSPVLAIPLAGLVGVFVLGAQMALYGLSPRFYPAGGQGAGIGTAVGAGRIGSFIGPILGGVLIGGGASGEHIALLLVPLALCAGVVMLALMAALPARRACLA